MPNIRIIEAFKKHKALLKLVISLILVCNQSLWAQDTIPFGNQDSYVSLQDNDTTKKKRIKIINTDEFRFITDTTNTPPTTIRKFTGNVFFQHKGTDFYCDRAIQYIDSSTVVASGEVHIQKPDTFDVWADYLVYYSDKKLAKFRGNVIFQDSSAKLITDSLDYDMNKDVGYFWSGGTFMTDSSTLTSEEGVYYQKRDEAFFYKNVHLSNPDFDLYADSMRYDTEEQVAYFIAATKIVNGEDVIYCNSGFYDTKTNKAQFGGNTQMKSGSTKISADELVYDKDIGYGEARGNVIWEDTVEQITIISNYTEYRDSLSYVMATEDPLLIDITDGDTMYLSADTLITYKLPYPKALKVSFSNQDSTSIDSVSQIGNSLTSDTSIDADTIISNTIITDSLIALTDSISSEEPLEVETQINSDSIITEVTTAHSDSIPIVNSIEIEEAIDYDSIRIFHAYKNTRMLQGRMSGICDSFYFSTGDSIFRLTQNPMVWVDTTQFTGDSIHLALKNKALDKIYIYNDAMIVHENVEGVYDQTKGKLVEGFFKDEKLTKMEIKGNGESIYFIKDDSSAFVGGNQTICSKMVITMKPGENDVEYITFITKPEATFTPFRMINLNSYQLTGFTWLFDKKPKNVDDIVRYRPMYEYFLQYLSKGSKTSDTLPTINNEFEIIEVASPSINQLNEK